MSFGRGNFSTTGSSSTGGYNRSGGYSNGNNNKNNDEYQYGSTQGGYMPSSDNGNEPSAKKLTQQSLLPVTISQLNSAQSNQESGFTINGRDVTQVKIVAAILTVREVTTNYTLDVSDGTGKIEVRMWMENENENTDMTAFKKSALRENTYVRIIGHLRAFMDKRSINAFRITAVTDFNEVTFHMLEVISDHLYITRGPLQQPSSFSNTTTSSHNAWVDTPGTHHPGMGSQYITGNQSNNSNFNEVQRAIMNVFKNYSRNAEGVSYGFVCTQLREVADPEMIKNEILFLNNEGHLYTTIDDDHYKCTDS